MDAVQPDRMIYSFSEKHQFSFILQQRNDRPKNCISGVQLMQAFVVTFWYSELLLSHAPVHPPEQEPFFKMICALLFVHLASCRRSRCSTSCICIISLILVSTSTLLLTHNEDHCFQRLTLPHLTGNT